MRFIPVIALLSALVWSGVSAAPAAATVAKTTSAKAKTVTSASKKAQSKARASAKAPRTARTSKYKVRSGDSLYTIARAYGMKVGELKQLNGLSDSRLRPGQVLRVSGGRASRQGGRHPEAQESVMRPDTVLLAESSDTTPGEVGIEPIARSYLSIPYRWGAESRRSTDCSGFTQQVFREFSISLPRTAREQFTVGQKIGSEELKSGDLLFFRSKKKKYPTHVGIYLGGGKMIHASRSHHKVVVSDANHPYFTKRYLGAKRIANFLAGELDLELLARQVGAIDNSLSGAVTGAEGGGASVVNAASTAQAPATPETPAAAAASAETATAATTCAEAAPDIIDQPAATGSDAEDGLDSDDEAEPEPVGVPVPLDVQVGAVPPPDPPAVSAEATGGEGTTVAAAVPDGTTGSPQ